MSESFRLEHSRLIYPLPSVLNLSSTFLTFPCRHSLIGCRHKSDRAQPQMGEAAARGHHDAAGADEHEAVERRPLVLQNKRASFSGLLAVAGC